MGRRWKIKEKQLINSNTFEVKGKYATKPTVIKIK